MGIMIEIDYPIVQYNDDLLREQLLSIVPGVALSGNGFNNVLVHYPDATSQADIDLCAAQIVSHDYNGQTTEQEELSFVEAMRPIMQSWHKGNTTTTQALTQSEAVLDNHLNHKAIMNGAVWSNTRLIVNPLANVNLGAIIGNANAEAAYLWALFNYTTSLKTWRE